MHSIKKAEALEVYNQYGNTNEEAIIKIYIEIYGAVGGGENRNTFYTGTAYILIDMKENEFLSFEVDIFDRDDVST